MMNILLTRVERQHVKRVLIPFIQNCHELEDDCREIKLVRSPRRYLLTLAELLVQYVFESMCVVDEDRGRFRVLLGTRLREN